MTKLSDVTIVGGGIIGLLCARECVSAGARVTILDKSQMGQESSWAGGGILLPLYPWRQPAAITKLVLQSLLLYPALVDDLRNATGIDPELLNSGLLMTKNPDIDAAIGWCTENAITFTHQPPASLLAKLSVSSLNPLWLPSICQVRNPRLLQALQRDLLANGVKFVSDCELLGVKAEGARVQSIQTTAGAFPVNQLLLTTGAWSGQLWQTLFPDNTEYEPNIQPVKGQMILFEATPATLSTIVLDQSHYLIPRLDGKILVGSTVEHCEFDKSTDENTKLKLMAFAQELLPELQQFPVIKHWAGLRPGTSKGVPYISKHPTLENLSINAGHFRNGFAMAPASAQLLVDLLLNRNPKVSPEPYQNPNLVS